MQATAYCWPVIVEAFKQVNGTPHFANDFQEWFFGAFGTANYSAAADKIKAKAGKAAVVNAFFAENGFPDLVLEGDFVIGAVFRLIVEWATKGTQVPLEIDGSTYQGARFKTGNGITVHGLKGTPYPVITLATNQPGWSVLVHEYPDLSAQPFDLPFHGLTIVNADKAYFRASEVILPATKLDTDVDVSSFRGYGIGDYTVAEAKKKVRLELDHNGAKAEAAFGAVMECVSIPQPYTVTQSHLIIFKHERMDKPAFVGFSTPQSWVKA